MVVYNLRYPGQYYDSETGLNYNIARDYDPQVGRYVESDPIGLRGGVNTYGYVGASPVRWIDPRGLEGIGPWTYPAGPMRDQYEQARQGATYYGAEGHILIGGGLTSVTCTDECGAKRKFRYAKLCFGGALGSSFGAGLVGNMNGKGCRSETYQGYFYEAGASYGLLSGGYDVGYTDTGGSFPLPNGLSGVTEGGLSAGIAPRGAFVKSTWCYYFPLGQ